MFHKAMGGGPPAAGLSDRCMSVISLKPTPGLWFLSRRSARRRCDSDHNYREYVKILNTYIIRGASFIDVT